MVTNRAVLALDVGGTRIGVALASLQARLPRPLTTLINNDGVWDELAKIIQAEAVGILIVGLPRGLEGQATAQTAACQLFADELQDKLGLPVHLQDEAVTSKKAEAELEARGKPFKREDIDALAATYILEDWLSQNQGKID